MKCPICDANYIEKSKFNGYHMFECEECHIHAVKYNDRLYLLPQSGLDAERIKNKFKEYYKGG